MPLAGPWKCVPWRKDAKPSTKAPLTALSSGLVVLNDFAALGVNTSDLHEEITSHQLSLIGVRGGRTNRDCMEDNLAAKDGVLQ